MDPGQEQLNDGLTKRKYIRTRRRIATLEGQFRDYVNLFPPPDIFRTL